MEQARPTVKRVGLELGGNAPFIVFDDADLDKAVPARMASKYRNAGQTCVCANRIYVQDGVYDAFADKLAAAVKKLKVGAGTEEGVTTGPLINKAAVEKVEEHVADALKHGAKIVIGGKPSPLGGNFYEPTVLAGVTPQMRVAREETFGPVAPLFRFKTEEDAIAHGQRHAVRPRRLFLRARRRPLWRVAEALECGIVGINEGIISTEVAPFGGYKESGRRPRRLPPRHRGIPRDQVHADGRPITEPQPHSCVRRALRVRQRHRMQAAGKAMSNDALKVAASERALEYVENGMRLGLGTGSTAAKFVDLLGKKVPAVSRSCVSPPPRRRRRRPRRSASA